MARLLEGQRALVTGGTSGIGRAIALRFAEQGAEVAIFGTHHERGAQVVSEIRAMPNNPKAIFYPVDVSKPAEVQTCINELLVTFGSVDILVNNAGITRDKLLLKMSEEDWNQVMEVNVRSCFSTCKGLIYSMMKAKKGRIINMSSVVGLTGNAGQVNYASSKAAVIGFTKALAKELASRNILVNCIAPGFIQTAMTDAMSEGMKEKTVKEIPIGRIGKTTEIADVALFLASSMADYITGQVIAVDGGISI